MGNGYKVNSQIETSKVNLVLSDGTMNEDLPLSQALKLAEDSGLDVVEVSKSKEGISICKLIDHGKMMYEKSKKEKKNHKQHQQTKEIKYGFNIDKHDLVVKHNKIFKFLAKNYIVRYSLELKGREKYLLDAAKEKMSKNLEDFEEVAQWKDVKVSHGGSRIVLSTILHQI